LNSMTDNRLPNERMIWAQRISSISLTLTFIVILAGSIVRMTGSGMGCPDWPKCFGLMIPPTSIEDVTFHHQQSYSPGMMVIRNDTLWVASKEVPSGPWNHEQWEKYPHHNYAIFNPLHTWIEYINRLATVLYGIPILLLIPISYSVYRRTGRKAALWVALFINLTVLYEAWLGKLVVDGVLEKGSVTLHMAGSIALIVLITIYRYKLVSSNKFKSAIPSNLKAITIIMGILTLIQIFLGTQVRECTDVIATTHVDRSDWIKYMPNIFLIHRTSSWLLLITSILLCYRSKIKMGMWLGSQWVLLLVITSMSIGIIMAEYNMPPIAQPLHLLFAALLIFVITKSVVVSGTYEIKSLPS